MRSYFFVFVIGLTMVSQIFAAPPLFLMGDGKIKIKNSHHGAVVDVVYVNAQGELMDQSFAQIDKVFGYPTAQNGENISRRLVGMLDYFSDQFAPGKTIVMISGYRSPTYNQNLRKNGKKAAKTSTHMDGMAIDFSLEGVSGDTMWEKIRAQNCCGVGHYGGNTIHLDAGRPRFWQAATSKVDTDASAFNRYIYLSTEYDRYQPQERVRLFFTSVSDFGFGIKTDYEIVAENDLGKKSAKGKIKAEEKTKCLILNDRRATRFIYTTLPKNLKPGRYHLKVEFCEKTAKEMPDEVVTNVVELTSPSP